MTYNAVLLFFFDLIYLNLTKSQLSNKKLGMVPEVTLILNTEHCHQVSIIKNVK